MKAVFAYSIILPVFWALSVSTMSHLQAQHQPNEGVIAITRDGTIHTAAQRLRAIVFPSDLYPSVIRVHLENEAGNYVKVELMNHQSQKVHPPVFIFDKKGVIKYDLEKMPKGKYMVRISNKEESQLFEVSLTEQTTPLIQVKRGILAKAN